MKTLLLWIGMLGFVAFGVTLEGGHIGSVFQVTAAIMVLIPVFCYFFFAFGFKGFFSFCKRVLNDSVTENDSRHIDTGVTLGFLFAAMSAVFGMIHVMENLVDTSKLGAGVALSFVSVVYGILPAILLLPAKAHVSHANSTTNHLKKAAGFMVATMLMLGGTFMTVLYVTSSRL